MRYLHIPSVIVLYIALPTSTCAAEKPFNAFLWGIKGQENITIVSKMDKFTITDVKVNGGKCVAIANRSWPATLGFGEEVRITPFCKVIEMTLKSGTTSWIMTFE